MENPTNEPNLSFEMTPRHEADPAEIARKQVDSALQNGIGQAAAKHEPETYTVPSANFEQSTIAGPELSPLDEVRLETSNVIALRRNQLDLAA